MQYLKKQLCIKYNEEPDLPTVKTGGGLAGRQRPKLRRGMPMVAVVKTGDRPQGMVDRVTRGILNGNGC